MTKAATIDRRRVLHIMVVAAMMLATLLAALIPTVVSAADNPADNEGSVEGGFSLNNGAPVVNSVTLYENDNTTTALAMDPTVDYIVQVSVTDPNTLADLESLYVTVYYDEDGAYDTVPSSYSADNACILKWDALDTWSFDDGTGTTWDIETDSEDPASLAAQNTYTFCFHFTVGEIARESSHDTGNDAEWMIYAEATDLSASTDDAYQETLEMNWYGKISVVVDGGGNVAFGTLSLGATDQACTNTVTATYTSNGPYDEGVKADALWNGSTMDANLSTDATADNGEIVLKADDDQTLDAAVLVVSSGYTPIDDTSSITSETGDGVTMKLWITIASSGLENESFTGTIFYQISNGS